MAWSWTANQYHMLVGQPIQHLLLTITLPLPIRSLFMPNPSPSVTDAPTGSRSPPTTVHITHERFCLAVADGTFDILHRLIAAIFFVL
jgi:hypothetical protein